MIDNEKILYKRPNDTDTGMCYPHYCLVDQNDYNMQARNMTNVSLQIGCYAQSFDFV